MMKKDNRKARRPESNTTVWDRGAEQAVKSSHKGKVSLRRIFDWAVLRVLGHATVAHLSNGESSVNDTLPNHACGSSKRNHNGAGEARSRCCAGCQRQQLWQGSMATWCEWPHNVFTATKSHS